MSLRQDVVKLAHQKPQHRTALLHWLGLVTINQVLDAFTKWLKKTQLEYYSFKNVTRTPDGITFSVVPVTYRVFMFNNHQVMGVDYQVKTLPGKLKWSPATSQLEIEIGGSYSFGVKVTEKFKKTKPTAFVAAFVQHLPKPFWSFLTKEQIKLEEAHVQLVLTMLGANGLHPILELDELSGPFITPLAELKKLSQSQAGKNKTASESALRRAVRSLTQRKLGENGRPLLREAAKILQNTKATAQFAEAVTNELRKQLKSHPLSAHVFNFVNWNFPQVWATPLKKNQFIIRIPFYRTRLLASNMDAATDVRGVWYPLSGALSMQAPLLAGKKKLPPGIEIPQLVHEFLQMLPSDPDKLFGGRPNLAEDPNLRKLTREFTKTIDEKCPGWPWPKKMEAGSAPEKIPLKDRWWSGDPAGFFSFKPGEDGGDVYFRQVVGETPNILEYELHIHANKGKRVLKESNLTAGQLIQLFKNLPAILEKNGLI